MSNRDLEFVVSQSMNTNGVPGGYQPERCVVSDEAVEAVARSLYGELEYDALEKNSQVRLAYVTRAKSLLQLAEETTHRGTRSSREPNS